MSKKAECRGWLDDRGVCVGSLRLSQHPGRPVGLAVLKHGGHVGLLPGIASQWDRQ